MTERLAPIRTEFTVQQANRSGASRSKDRNRPPESGEIAERLPERANGA